MKVEFLYFEGCPNHEVALTNLREVLRAAGLKDEIEIISIETPEAATRHRFLGSPSIRINHQDLEITEDDSTEYSLRCRRYKNGEALAGIPSQELIRAKLMTAQGD